MKQHIRAALVAGALVFGAAHAQTPATRSTAASNDELAEVVVTGSRVIRNGNDSPTPVTVVTVQETETVRPSTIADQLNDMPQFSGSRGQMTNPQSGRAGGNGVSNQQGNTLNLRNFGVTRTMILADGHRVAPTSGDGSVNVDMIPQLLLQRVDIVTGGASAVYGSDAVTGVVNFITDTNFKGMKVNGQAGQSIFHDDPTQAIGLAWGGELFGGRGHALASYEYRSDAGVDRRSSRPFFQTRPVVHQQSSTLTQVLYRLDFNVTQADRTFGGLITQVGNTVNPFAGMHFCQNGVICPYAHGVPIGTGQWEAGGDGSYYDTSLKAALKMHQLFGRLDYDFTDTVHGYVKTSGTYNYNTQYSVTPALFNSANSANSSPMRADNPYLAQQYRTTLAAAGVTTFNLAKTQRDLPRQFAETFEHQYAIDAGLSGQFGDDYHWELAFVRGSNRLTTRQNYGQNGKKMAAALDAVLVTSANVGSTGQILGSIVCNVTLTNPGLYPGCVPYNPFGPDTATADVSRYIFTPIEVMMITNMNDAEASLTGAPFNSWAGPVNMALSAQWRKLTYRQDSTANLNSFLNPLDCTGLRLIAAACTSNSQEWFQSASPSGPERSTTVREGAVEADLPLLKGKFLAKDVNLNGAYRYTNYSTSGTVGTWKAGLTWQLNDSLTVRGTRSRDIRAPTLFELFQPPVAGNFNGTDFLTNCSLNGTTRCASDNQTHQPAQEFQQGNPNLKPEKADTTTAGIVYRPRWAPGLSVALDGYVINIRDAILSQNGNSSTAENGCAASGGASPLCALIVRPINCCSNAGANSATTFYQIYLNVASQWTEGADLEVNYTGRVREMPYNLHLLAAYQPHNVSDVQGSGRTENAGFFGSAPIVRASLIASITPMDNLKISVLERWRDRALWLPRQSAPLQALVAPMPDISPSFYTNLNVGYTLKHGGGGQTEIYGNIANLFDREPPISAAYNNVQPGIFGVIAGDDVIGRYYTVGFRHRL